MDCYKWEICTVMYNDWTISRFNTFFGEVRYGTIGVGQMCVFGQMFPRTVRASGSICHLFLIDDALCMCTRRATGPGPPPRDRGRLVLIDGEAGECKRAPDRAARNGSIWVANVLEECHGVKYYGNAMNNARIVRSNSADLGELVWLGASCRMAMLLWSLFQSMLLPILMILEQENQETLIIAFRTGFFVINIVVV